jgi:hypothetical protein
MLLGAQKARSVGWEAVGDDEAGLTVLTALEPWLYGERCVVPVLADRLDNPKTVDPLEYRNLMMVALRFCPAIALASVNYGGVCLPLAEALDEPMTATWE